jgi:hypothetical protein
MKIKYYLLLILSCFLLSCKKNSTNGEESLKEKQLTFLPFKNLNLVDLKGFKPVAKNWQIVGDVYVDQNKERTFISSPGDGILLNTPDKDKRENLFTTFEHGDIEIELDVMMPIHSNSGLYFQGRYEVQLFDSWGKKKAEYHDIGGIYQRWDADRQVKGYEGHPPRVNAAKAPGLWQHFKIIFHAPKFDKAGNKIKNAWFEEVWLNGELLHKNQEASGPTASATFDDEKPMGPLMIQGDHAGVAIRNIKYKLYEDKKVTLSSLKMKEFETTYPLIPDYDTLTAERELTTDSISSNMATGKRPKKLLVYNGTMNIPKPGEYLFELRVRLGGGLLLIDGDTIANLNGDYYHDEPAYGLVPLQEGEVPFTFIYNKHRPFWKGFSLQVEGPGIAKHNLHAPQSFVLNSGGEKLMAIEASAETVIQRSFLLHEGVKRTHCISVATPKGINYSFDLAFGSLLQVWEGDFFDATEMWNNRGIEQLGSPIGSPIIIHGNPDFAFLESEKASWPDSIPSTTTYKQLGYELDQNGDPSFFTQLDDILITNRFVPNDTLRKLNRLISLNADMEIWHKVAAGSIIEKLPDNTYAIDDKNYFVNFTSNENYQTVIRRSAGKDELIMKIPTGNQEINYTITW